MRDGYGRGIGMGWEVQEEPEVEAARLELAHMLAVDVPVLQQRLDWSPGFLLDRVLQNFVATWVEPIAANKLTDDIEEKIYRYSTEYILELKMQEVQEEESQ
jgi:hypothetical protein